MIVNPSLSLRARLLRRAVRWLVAPTVSGDAPVAHRRRSLETRARATRLPLPACTRVETTTLRGVPAEWVRNARVEATRTVLYVHGGAYAVGSPRVYREFTARLALRWQAQIAVVDYRLAPEHRFPAAIDDVFAAYQALLEQNIAARDIVIAGDSAGGGLALACAVRARDAGLPLPSALVLISPWVDLEVAGATAQGAARDDMLVAERLRAAAADYLGSTSARTPLASPLYADLRRLPPTLIQVTDPEVLLDDSRRLADAMQTAGTTVELRVWRGLWHVWPIFAGKMPEADAAVEEAAGFLGIPQP